MHRRGIFLLFAAVAALGCVIACSSSDDEITTEEASKHDGGDESDAADAARDSSSDAYTTGWTDAVSNKTDAKPIDPNGCNVGSKCQVKKTCCRNSWGFESTSCPNSFPIFCCIPDGYTTMNGGGECCSGNAAYSGSQLTCTPKK